MCKRSYWQQVFQHLCDVSTKPEIWWMSKNSIAQYHQRFFIWWGMNAFFVHSNNILTDSFPVFGMTQVSISCFPTITERLPVLLLISIWGGILNPIWFAVMRLRMFPLLWRTADDVFILFLVQDVVKVTDLCGEATADLKDLIKELRSGRFDFNENPWAASNSRDLVLLETTS